MASLKKAIQAALPVLKGLALFIKPLAPLIPFLEWLASDNQALAAVVKAGKAAGKTFK